MYIILIYKYFIFNFNHNSYKYLYLNIHIYILANLKLLKYKTDAVVCEIKNQHILVSIKVNKLIS